MPLNRFGRVTISFYWWLIANDELSRTISQAWLHRVSKIPRLPRKCPNKKLERRNQGLWMEKLEYSIWPQSIITVHLTSTFLDHSVVGPTRLLSRGGAFWCKSIFVWFFHNFPCPHYNKITPENKYKKILCHTRRIDCEGVVGRDRGMVLQSLWF